jgi:hypothetical protein
MIDLAKPNPWCNLSVKAPGWHDEIKQRNERLVGLVRGGTPLTHAAREVGVSSSQASQIVRLYGIAFERGRPRHG